MNIKITPTSLSGEIPAITSKSAAHRLLICSALSDKALSDINKPVKLMISDLSEDINATIACLSALGAKIFRNGSIVEVNPINLSEIKSNILLDCGESGSILRFLLPVAAAIASKTGTSISFTGGGRLPERPLNELVSVLEENGADFNFSTSRSLPLTVGGKLKSGRFVLPGNVSSQYISGLMFALPLLSGMSEIVLFSPPQSVGYIDMTKKSLEMFGIDIKNTENGWLIKGNQPYVSPDSDIIEVEKDWSNAAFFLAAGAIGSEITVTGLDLDSAQGDKRILDILKNFGADIKISNSQNNSQNSSHKIITVKKDKLVAQEIDVSDIPDLLPILAIVGACSESETILYNAARLRLKESDRLSTTAMMLKALGCQVREENDRLIITGQGMLGLNDFATGIVDSSLDHRITMSGAIAAIVSKREVVIQGAEAANKSYPAFFEDYKKLGGIINVV